MRRYSSINISRKYKAIKKTEASLEYVEQHEFKQLRTWNHVTKNSMKSDLFSGCHQSRNIQIFNQQSTKEYSSEMLRKYYAIFDLIEKALIRATRVTQESRARPMRIQMTRKNEPHIDHIPEIVTIKQKLAVISPTINVIMILPQHHLEVREDLPKVYHTTPMPGAKKND